MIQIPLTPEQYQVALKHLIDAKSPDVESFLLPSETNPGQLVNKQISIQFTYDGFALSVNILEKHGLARFASDSTIKSHLVDLLGKV